MNFLANPMHKEGKNQVKVKSLSRVRLFATPWTDSPPGFSVHGIFQARVLEWGATAFSESHMSWSKFPYPPNEEMIYVNSI